MHRFHVPPGLCGDNEIVLTDREAHHGLNVLRVRRGESVVVLDGAGTEYRCEAVELGRHSIRLRILEKRTIPRQAGEVTLIQGIPKGKTFDTIVQKATELGAARIVPLITERVVTHLDEDRSETKLEHWRTTAIEAIKQCGSAWLPEIAPPTPIEDLTARRMPSELSLLASLQPGSRHPRACFNSFQEIHRRLPATVSVWVGPEGDFTATELAAIQSTGAQPITLGRLVLRSDTAAICCLTVVNYELESSRR